MPHQSEKLQITAFNYVGNHISCHTKGRTQTEVA